jgi:amidase
MSGQLDGFSTATELLHALSTREISALELLDVHLQRIERYNPELNAIVTPDYENARRVAQAADEVWMQGEDKPLLGLPIVIKDCIYVKGLPTTGGVPERADAIADSDAPGAVWDAEWLRGRSY